MSAVVTAVGMEIEPRNASQDPDLAALLAAWETLPSALKAGIVAMVKAAERSVHSSIATGPSVDPAASKGTPSTLHPHSTNLAGAHPSTQGIIS